MKQEKTLNLLNANGLKLSLIENDLGTHELFLVKGSKLVFQKIYPTKEAAMNDFKFYSGEIRETATKEMQAFAEFLRIGFENNFLELKPVGTPEFSELAEQFWYELGQSFLTVVDLLPEDRDSVLELSKRSEIRNSIEQFNKSFFKESTGSES